MTWPAAIRSATLLPLLLVVATVAPAGGMQAGDVPQALTFGDFNGDGRRDLAVANAFSDDVSIFTGKANGSFMWARHIPVGRLPGTENDLPRDLIAADVDADGYDDLLVLCSGFFFNPPSLTVLCGVGDAGANFRQRAVIDLVAGTTPLCFALGDLNADGIPDLLVGDSTNDSVTLRAGDGTGLFAVAGSITLGSSDAGVEDLELFDLDGDGDLDVLGVTSTRLFIVAQGSAGLYGATPTLLPRLGGASLHALVAGDFDGDAWRDWAAADATGRVHLYHDLAIGGFFAGSVATINDATLAGSTDMAAVDWDGDGRLELLVTTLQFDALIVVDPRNGIVTSGIATGAAPRALLVVDLDLNGLPDIMTANEGDETDPSNEDVSWLINPNATPQALQPLGVAPIDVLARAGAGLRTVRGLGAEESDRFWCADPRRNVLAEVRDDGRPRDGVHDASAWGVAQVSDVTVGDSDVGYVTDRLDTTIRRVDLDTGELMGSTYVPFAAGALGFSGIARDPGNGRFYLAAPAVSSVVVAESTGYVSMSFPTEFPPHDIALDRVAGRLLVSAPGKRRALAYTTAGARVPSGDVSLDDFGPLFGRSGIAGIGWASENPAEVIVATTDGAVARLARNSLSVVAAGNVAPGGRVRSMGACPLMPDDAAYLLDEGAVPTMVVVTPLAISYTFDLTAAVVAPQRLDPGAVAYTSAPSTTFVIDRRRLLIAQFTYDSSTPVLTGFLDYEPMRPAGLRAGPIRGLALDATTGDFFANVDGQVVLLPRSESGTVAQPEIVGHFSLAGGPADIEFVGGRLAASLGGAPAIASYSDGRPTYLEPTLFAGPGLGAMTVLPISGALLVGDPATGMLHRFAVPSASVTASGFVVR